MIAMGVAFAGLALAIMAIAEGVRRMTK